MFASDRARIEAQIEFWEGAVDFWRNSLSFANRYQTDKSEVFTMLNKNRAEVRLYQAKLAALSEPA